MSKSTLFTDPDSLDVASGLGKTQGTIQTTADLIGIIVILDIVLPEAHFADIATSAVIQGMVSPARTSVLNTYDGGFIDP